jgi:hypothetical protein
MSSKWGNWDFGLPMREPPLYIVVKKKTSSCSCTSLPPLPLSKLEPRPHFSLSKIPTPPALHLSPRIPPRSSSLPNSPCASQPTLAPSSVPHHRPNQIRRGAPSAWTDAADSRVEARAPSRAEVTGHSRALPVLFLSAARALLLHFIACCSILRFPRARARGSQLDAS